MQKTVTIYGAGYVGLVTAVCLAELGHRVLLIDTQVEKIAALSQGICPIFEPGLPELLARHSQSGLLTFSTDLSAGVAHGLFQFIAVGTPSNPDGSANLEYVFDVARGIVEQSILMAPSEPRPQGSVASDKHSKEVSRQSNKQIPIIVVKSTVPVGTSQEIKKLMGNNFNIISNPEFLKQGAAIEDAMHPDRIIIGAENEQAFQHMRDLYADLHTQLIEMDLASAELTKYASNAYLATRISFINEMSQLAEHVGADIDMIRRGMGSDKRIGPHFLMAGCGYGGSCFPKDVSALINMSEAVSCDASILQAAEKVNQHQKQILFQKISAYFSGDLKNKTIALWGLAFKPNTDDMREAPSRVLIDALLKAGASVQAYDPAARVQAEKIYDKKITYCETAQAALDQADILVIVTEWDEFKSPDFNVIRDALRYPAIFDGRNLYDPAVVTAHGLKYFSIGRGT